jgi:HEAT repeat protein
LHALWILVRLGGQDSIEELLKLAQTEPEAKIRSQAVRAVADLTDPVLLRHRLDAGPGDPDFAVRLAALAAREPDKQVSLEYIIALSRLRWWSAPDWLRETLKAPDATLSHATMQMLRRSENWAAILKLLDETDNHPVRTIAIRALANQAQPAVVDGLTKRPALRKGNLPAAEYADLLTRV